MLKLSQANVNGTHRVHRLIVVATLIAIAVSSLVFAETASASVLAEWTFLDDAAATTVASGVQASNVVNGPGIPSTGGGVSGTNNNLFVRTNTVFNGPIVTDGDYTDASNETSVIDANDYFEFTITPESGYTLDIGTVSFDYFAQDLAENKGPVPFFKSFLRSGVDGFTNTLVSHTFENVAGTVPADTGTTETVNLVATLDSSFDALTETTTFRLYFTDGVNSGSNLLIHRVDNLRIEGVVTTPLPGDANGDGSVDLQDFGLLKANFGTTAGATWAMGDFNDDGAVDLQDFGLLKANFGAGGTAVPEPATLSLLVISGIGLLKRRNRK